MPDYKLITRGRITAPLTGLPEELRRCEIVYSVELDQRRLPELALKAAKNRSRTTKIGPLIIRAVRISKLGEQYAPSPQGL